MFAVEEGLERPDEVEGPGTALDVLSARAQEYVSAAQAPNTLRAYRSDWRELTSWTTDRRLQALPAAPSTVPL